MKGICHSGAAHNFITPFHFSQAAPRGMPASALLVCSLPPSSDPTVAAWRVINFHQTRSFSPLQCGVLSSCLWLAVGRRRRRPPSVVGREGRRPVLGGLFREGIFSQNSSDDESGRSERELGVQGLR